jgi:hypothetical protein
MARPHLLNKIPRFSECSRAELEAVAAVTDELRLPAGRVLMRQGTVAASCSCSSTAK